MLKQRCNDIEAATAAAMTAYQKARDSEEESVCQAEERLKKEVEDLANRILDIQSQQLKADKDSVERASLKAKAEELEAVKVAKVTEWKAKCDEVEAEWDRVTKANAPKPFSFLRGRPHDKAATPTGTPKAKKEASSAKPSAKPSPAAAPSPTAAADSSPAPKKKKGGSFLRGPPPK